MALPQNTPRILCADHPITTIEADIQATESAIVIRFPEKRDDFRAIVKSMGFYWDKDSWKKLITYRTGSYLDRAAEAGHKLMQAGFNVKIDDKVISILARYGQYEKEHTRWIAVRREGIYAGRFAIHWRERNSVLYDAARRLSGACWSKPDVVVPPYQYREVLGFAEIYSFRLTPEALSLCKYGKIVRYSIIKAKPIEILDLSVDEFVRMDEDSHLSLETNYEVYDEFKD